MNKLKALRLKVGKLMLDKSSRSNNPQSLEHPKSFLFLRQDGKIGDYIVSSFVFREIKKFNPLIKIGVNCTKKNAYLFQKNKNIDGDSFSGHVACRMWKKRKRTKGR